LQQFQYFFQEFGFCQIVHVISPSSMVG